jgi:hypothetical protein
MSQQPTRGPMPPELSVLWHQHLAGVDRSEIDRKFQLCEQAAAEPSFSGWLRRSIHEAGIPLSLLADQVSIPPLRLASFLEGQMELATGEVDRLCLRLGVVPVGSTS